MKFTVGVLPFAEIGKGTRHDGVNGGEGGILAVGMQAAQTTVLLDGADNSSRNSGGAGLNRSILGILRPLVARIRV